MSDFSFAFRSASRLWSRNEVLARPSPVPKAPGVYAWYLRELPPGVPDADCVQCNSLTLLYIGIAPRPPAKNGIISRTTLQSRLRQHYASNASGSTLRRTLGCLLADRLGIELRRAGNGERMTFGAREHKLSDWMGENAFVAWIEHPAPWEIEPALIRELRPPLNLADVVRESKRSNVAQENVMPFKSQAQRRKFAQLLVEGEISNQTFEEWNRETGAKRLPERVRRSKKASATASVKPRARKAIKRKAAKRR
jgi:hypothetical protein